MCKLTCFDSVFGWISLEYEYVQGDRTQPWRINSDGLHDMGIDKLKASKGTHARVNRLHHDLVIDADDIVTFNELQG